MNGRMSEIHVSREGASLGQFSVEQVRANLGSGEFRPTDFAWQAGMNDWKPLGEWPEFTGSTATTPALPTLAPGSALPEEIVEDGPPWEDRAKLGFFPAIIATVKAVLTQPSATFERMKQTGGLGGPLLYAVLLGWVGLGAAMGFQLMFQGAEMTKTLAEAESELPAFMTTGALTGVLIGYIIALPLFITIGLLIYSGLLHLSLMVVGGAKRSFETTFRVMAYAGGSTSILQAVPLVGPMVGGIWGLVAVIIGISKTHEISLAKAVLAYFLPAIALCGLIVVFAIGAGVIAAAAK